MLRISAVKIEINTTDGLYGSFVTFSEGLNILKGDNTTGKSTLIQAIFYGLGLEELIGGRGEKTMQSVLKDVVKDSEDNEHQVLSSIIKLEISNGKETVTTKRFVKGEDKDSRLIDVYKGAVLTENKRSDYISMFLHDAGAAQDDDYGFHYFLEKFIGWDLPEVTGAKARKTKLYIQSIFPAFFIEQKTGWSDYLATIPNYGIREGKIKAIEFILNLDALISDLKRLDIKEQKLALKTRWALHYENVQNLAKEGACELRGYPSEPEIVNSTNSVYLAIRKDDALIQLTEHVDWLRREYTKLESEIITSAGQNVEIFEIQLEHLKEILNNADFRQNKMLGEQKLEEEKLSGLRKQLSEIEHELRKNKFEGKLKNFGSELEFEISTQFCPTCQQPIKDMLLPQDIDQIPMRIEENIKYLEAQKEMLVVYIANQEKIIERNYSVLTSLINKISEIRTEIRSIKRDLISDDRLPSEKQIEDKIRIRNQRDYYSKLQERFNEKLGDLLELSHEYEVIRKDEERIPKEEYSFSDREKLSGLQNDFKRMLKKFNYRSKDMRMITISNDNYLPVVSNEGRNYNIRFDSSASDFIRSIWAYTTALLKVSQEYGGNHPGLVIFDEPEQHSMADDSTRYLLEELETYNEHQSLLAISFHAKDEVFKQVTQGVKFNLIEIDGLVVKKIH